jgi:hypothetical protein
MAGRRGSQTNHSSDEGEEDWIALPQDGRTAAWPASSSSPRYQRRSRPISQAPGLGWSSDEHPGHVLFPSFALLLAHRTSRSVPDALLADLDSTCRDPLEVLSSDDVERRLKLSTPSIATLIKDVSSTITFVEADLRSMVDSMCVAAESRVEGILGRSRRRHYGHAAMLAASCVALAPAGNGKDLSAWMMGLRQTYSRRHAFRQELRRAMASFGVRD